MEIPEQSAVNVGFRKWLFYKRNDGMCYWDPTLPRHWHSGNHVDCCEDAATEDR